MEQEIKALQERNEAIQRAATQWRDTSKKMEQEQNEAIQRAEAAEEKLRTYMMGTHSNPRVDHQQG